MSVNIFPQSVVKLLEGEAEAPQSWGALIDLGRDSYQAGKAGRPYAPMAAPEVPEFPSKAVELVNRFLLNCWKQGAERAGA